MADGRKRVVVTGAGSGIGAATAKLLLLLVWLVVCFVRDPAAAKKVAGDAPVIAADVADEAAVVRAFDEARKLFGGLDALAAIAGIYDTTPFFEITAEIYRRIHVVFVFGFFFCLCVGVLLMQSGGRICTVASVAGLRGGGLAGTAAYASSKGAILALTKNAARVLGPKGIAVNTIAPGMIDTPFAAGPLSDPDIRQRSEGMTSFNRLGTPEEIAEAIVWLLSPEASYVHGATLVADGGMVMY